MFKQMWNQYRMGNSTIGFVCGEPFEEIEEVGQFIGTSIWLLAKSSILFVYKTSTASAKRYYAAGKYIWWSQSDFKQKHTFCSQAICVEEVRHNLNAKTLVFKKNKWIFLYVYVRNTADSIYKTAEEEI